MPGPKSLPLYITVIFLIMLKALDGTTQRALPRAIHSRLNHREPGHAKERPKGPKGPLERRLSREASSPPLTRGKTPRVPQDGGRAHCASSRRSRRLRIECCTRGPRLQARIRHAGDASSPSHRTQSRNWSNLPLPGIPARSITRLRAVVKTSDRSLACSLARRSPTDNV